MNFKILSHVIRRGTEGVANDKLDELCVLSLFCVGNLRIDRRIEPLLWHPLQFPRNAKTKNNKGRKKA